MASIDARESARGGGPGVGPLRGCVVLNQAFTLRCTFAPKRARASRPGGDDERANCHVRQVGDALPNRLSSAVME